MVFESNHRIVKITVLVSTFLCCVTFSAFTQQKDESRANITQIVLLSEPVGLDLEGLIKDLNYNWDLEVRDTGDVDSATLIVDSHIVKIMLVDKPVPLQEVQEIAAFNYLWKNGVEEISKHKGHILVSILGGGDDLLEKNLLLTKVVYSALRYSPALGVYFGERALTIEKNIYLKEAKNISIQRPPILLWIYIGVYSEDGMQSAYTVGMHAFNKKEMEILDSGQSMNEISTLLANLADYVISNDAVLEDGETVGFTKDQRLKLSISRGQFVNGETVKIEYK
jgi:hypothetical protein